MLLCEPGSCFGKPALQFIAPPGQPVPTAADRLQIAPVILADQCLPFSHGDSFRKQCVHVSGNAANLIHISNAQRRFQRLCCPACLL
ncbi:hypothetical protein D3C75_589760 [compost metagenome]